MNGNKHAVAWWAGTSAFFGSLLAVGAIDVFNLNGAAEFLGSILVAAVTAGAVYSKQRLDEAKKGEDE